AQVVALIDRAPKFASFRLHGNADRIANAPGKHAFSRSVRVEFQDRYCDPPKDARLLRLIVRESGWAGQNGVVFRFLSERERAHYNSFEERVLPVLVKHNIGVLAMKPMGDHIILESKTATPLECLHYAMNLPTSVVITGCDSLPILEQALKAVRTFKPMSKDEVASLLAKTAKAARNGQFEQYKTTHNF